MSAIFLLTLCLAVEYQCLLEGSFAHIWDTNFCSCQPEDGLLSPVARGAFIPGSHSTVEIGELVLGRLSPQGTTQRAACGTPLPSLSVKEASLLILELQSKE